MKKILLLLIVMFFMVAATPVNSVAGPCSDNIAGVWYAEEIFDESLVTMSLTLVSDGTGFLYGENNSPSFNMNVIGHFTWNATGDTITMSDGTMIMFEFSTGELIERETLTEPDSETCDHTGDALTIGPTTYNRQ